MSNNIKDVDKTEENNFKENEKTKIRNEFFNFFQFIHENDLREEALELINRLTEKSKRRENL